MVNSLNWDRTELLAINCPVEYVEVQDTDGNSLVSQIVDMGVKGYKVFWIGHLPAHSINVFIIIEHEEM